MLTVSVPTRDTEPELLLRCVNSILASVGVDLRVIVVNDGGEPIDLPNDDRIVRYDLADNMGRYFCDSVVVEALRRRKDEYWTTLDSDDYVEPDHYARLIAHASDGVAVSPYWRHNPSKPAALQRPLAHRFGNPPSSFIHLFHWCAGVYRIDRVLLAGGISPQYRVGFDSLFGLMVVLTGHVDVVDEPGYHWCRRPTASLTTHPLTGFGSNLRVRTKRELSSLYLTAKRHTVNDPGRAIREAVPKELRARVLMHAARLRGVM